MLPLRLGRQAGACPAGVGVGLVEAQVRDRRIGVDRHQAVQRHPAPAARAVRFVRAPVERGIDAFALHPGPAVRQPQRGLAVAAVFHEGQPFAVGDGVRGQRVRLQPDGVARPFAVEHERGAVVGPADLHWAAAEVGPAGRVGRVTDGRGRPGGGIGRAQRVLREQVQHVGQQQLLVLLFVVQAQRDEPPDRLRNAARQQALHGRVHMGAVGEHLVQRGPRQHAPARPRVAGADGLVVRIEQVAVACIRRAVAGHVGAEDECFEKPGGVGQVPLGGAGVVHRLDGGVGVGQRRGQRQGLRPDRVVLQQQCGQCGGGHIEYGRYTHGVSSRVAGMAQQQAGQPLRCGRRATLSPIS